MAKLKALYYINQFYAGIGGEDKADVGLQILDEKKGPALGIEKYWKDEMEVVQVIACGDNFVNNNKKYETILPEIDKILEKIKPDVFIAGPAFNAGRYGVACAKITDYVRNKGIPAVTSMYYENPAVKMYVKDNYIIETPETAAGMRKVLPKLGTFALKLAKGEKILALRFEGYLPRGYRYNEYHENTGAERVVDILLKKLNNKPYRTEVPLRGFEIVAPTNAIKNIKEINAALITTGGLVPMGNPDKLKQAFSVTYGKYNVEGIDTVEKGKYESIHGGYDTTIADENPNRLIPLDAARELEKEGIIKNVYKEFFSTCGIGTNVENSKDIGQRMAAELKEVGVNAAFLTST